MLAVHPTVSVPAHIRSYSRKQVAAPAVAVNHRYGWTADRSMVVRYSDGALITPSAWAAGTR